jgi:hypothetical protein
VLGRSCTLVLVQVCDNRGHVPYLCNGSGSVLFGPRYVQAEPEAMTDIHGEPLVADLVSLALISLRGCGCPQRAHIRGQSGQYKFVHPSR